MNKPTINLEKTPNENTDKLIVDGLFDYVTNAIHDDAKQLSIYAKIKDELIGGAIIYEHSDTLYVDKIWIQENYRSQGIGTKIMNRLINYARESNIKKVFLDTFEFQAYDFYLKLHFKETGRAPGYLLGHDRIFMKLDM